MPLLLHRKRIQEYNWIIEDPDPRNSKIYIDNRAYDTKTLVPIMNDQFWMTDTTDVTAPGAEANWYDWPIIITNGKFGNSWSDGRQSWPGGPGRWDPWILSLDYDITLKRALYNPLTDSSIVVTPRDITGDNMRQDVFAGHRFNYVPTGRANTQNDFVTYITRTEDGYWLGYDHNNLGTTIIMTRPDITGVSIYGIRGNNAILQFYVGKDDQGAFNFIEVNCNTGCNYSFFRVSPQSWQGSTITATANAAVSTATLTNSIGGGFARIYQFPSNIKHNPATPNRKVIYSSHYNASGVLTPLEIIWDKNIGRFIYQNCVMTYPASASFTNYGAAPTDNNYSVNTNNTWWMKPHVFTVDGEWFISFLFIEKCIAALPSERWSASTLQRNWLTFRINPNDDNNLIYHSLYNWETSWDIPRSWVPITPNGEEILVMQNGRTRRMRFHASVGWVVAETFPIDTRAYGIDSTGRIYLINRANAPATLTGTAADLVPNTGYNSIYTYVPNTPRVMSVIPANTNYTYNGTNVESNIRVVLSDSKELVPNGNVRIGTFNPFGNPGNVLCGIELRGIHSRVAGINHDDYNFYGQDFCIEFNLFSPIAFTSQQANCGILSHKTSDSSNGWLIYRNSSIQTGNLALRLANTTNRTIDFFSNANVDTQTFQHWAVTRQGNILTWYKQGNVANVWSNVILNRANIYDYTCPFYIGYSQTHVSNLLATISNIRIVKGKAVYTGAFTPPNNVLPVVQGASTNVMALVPGDVVLLTGVSPQIIDHSHGANSQVRLKIVGDSVVFTDTDSNSINVSSYNGNAYANIKIIGSTPSYVTFINLAEPVWITNSLPNVTVNIYYSSNVLAVAANSITYSISSGALPSGINLLSNGYIYGINNDVANTSYNANIAATSGDNVSILRSFNISTIV